MDVLHQLLNMVDRHKMQDGHYHPAILPPTFAPFPLVATVTPGYWSYRVTKKVRRAFQLSPAALGVRCEE